MKSIKEINDTLELCHEALADWKKGTLSPFAAYCVIQSIFNPQQPSADDIKWAKEVLFQSGDTEPKLRLV